MLVGTVLGGFNSRLVFISSDINSGLVFISSGINSGLVFISSGFNSGLVFISSGINSRTVCMFMFHPNMTIVPSLLSTHYIIYVNIYNYNNIQIIPNHDDYALK